jgi:four helix bundle protein
MAKDLAVSVYRATEVFPRTERFNLTSQIRRSGTSIPSNIGEGWGRGSTREYIQFLLVARGSLLELETHLIVAEELGYLKQESAAPLMAHIQRVGQMLNRLIGALRSRIK